MKGNNSWYWWSILLAIIIVILITYFGCDKVIEPEVVNPGVTETVDSKTPERSKVEKVKLEILKTCFEVYESNVMMNTWTLAPAVKFKITNVSGQENNFSIDVMFYKIKEKEVVSDRFFCRTIPDQFSETIKAISRTGYCVPIPDTRKIIDGKIGVRIKVSAKFDDRPLSRKVNISSDIKYDDIPW